MYFMYCVQYVLLHSATVYRCELLEEGDGFAYCLVHNNTMQPQASLVCRVRGVGMQLKGY